MEKQQNPLRWYMVAFSVVLPGFFYWAVRSNTRFIELRYYLLILGVYSTVVGFTMISNFRKIIYQIDEQGIRYCIKPFGKWQTISWSEIDHAHVREFALIGEYPQGRGGTRQGPNGWAYVMDGNYGLQIDKKSGGKILIGTQRPDELRTFLQQNPVLS